MDLTYQRNLKYKPKPKSIQITLDDIIEQTKDITEIFHFPIEKIKAIKKYQKIKPQFANTKNPALSMEKYINRKNKKKGNPQKPLKITKNKICLEFN